MKSPCTHCEYRVLNCHSHCVDYLKFKECLEMINEKIQSEFEMKSYRFETTVKENKRNGRW